MVEVIELASDLAYLKTSFVNVYFAGNAESWVLIDTGIPGYAATILEAATARFGGAAPKAILLTHGHFDHAACALELAKFWHVPVYAHHLEFPYLKGESAYPQKDPTVGGAMGFISRFFPSRTANISEVLLDLPETRMVPGLEGWTWIPTPGHAPGQVAFWREHDRVLIAGDTLATVNLDSWRALVGWKKRLSRPALPFTYDWEAAALSIRILAALRPRVLACGHGQPLSGETLADDFLAFAETFTGPKKGRYSVEAAVTNQNGVVYEPPVPKDKLPTMTAGVVAGVFLLAGVVYSRRGKKDR